MTGQAKGAPHGTPFVVSGSGALAHPLSRAMARCRRLTHHLARCARAYTPTGRSAPCARHHDRRSLHARQRARLRRGRDGARRGHAGEPRHPRLGGRRTADARQRRVAGAARHLATGHSPAVAALAGRHLAQSTHLACALDGDRLLRRRRRRGHHLLDWRPAAAATCCPAGAAVAGRGQRRRDAVRARGGECGRRPASAHALVRAPWPSRAVASLLPHARTAPRGAGELAATHAGPGPRRTGAPVRVADALSLFPAGEGMAGR